MKKLDIIRKFFIFISLFFSVCCIFSGCNSQKKPKVEITFIHGWGSTDNDHEIMRQLYEDFQKEHEEIKLNIIALPSDLDVIKKMRELLTVGKVPDIVFTAGEGRDSIYNFMVNKGYAVNLSPYLKADEDFSKNVSPTILNYWMTDEGELYTISDVVLMGGYWYNRSIFNQAGISEPPKTWDEFESVCQRLKEFGEQSDTQINPLLLDTDHIVYLTNAILHETDPSALEDITNGFINFQSSGIQTSLEFLKHISKYSDTVDAYSFRDTLESFNKEETAIYINGVWGASLIDESIDSAYAAFPSSSGSSISMVSSGVGYILGDTKDERKINASIEFLKYMLSTSVGERLLAETKQIPSNPNIQITPETTSDRLFQAFTSVMDADYKIEFPANFWSYELQNTYGESVILYLENSIDLEQLQQICSSNK